MASLPYPRCPPNSFHRTHSKFVCASPPTEFTEFTEASGGGYSPTDCTDVGGYGIPAIPTPPSEFLPQNPLQVCLRKSSHRIHRIHRSFRRRIFSHGFHRIHRSFWRRRASHGFHRIHRFFFSASRFCVFREFCGKIVCWLRGYGRDALRIPSIEPTPSLFAQVLPRNSRNSQKFLAEDILQRISQMHTDFSSPPVVSVCSANSVGR